MSVACDLLSHVREAKKWQFARFVLVGAICTAVDLACYNIFLGFLPYVACAYIGFGCSFTLNYWLSAKWTFRKKPSVRNFVGMAIVHIINLVAARTLLLYAIVELLQINARLGYLFVLAISVISSYLLNKLVFEKL